MNRDEFFKLCAEKKYDLGTIEKALDLAWQELGEKKRLSGDSFFDHNLRSCELLVDINAEIDVIIACLLQGVGIGANEFGEGVTGILNGLDELRGLKDKNASADAASIRKILLSTLKDVRVVFVKLVNKYDNLCSVEVHTLDEQKRMAQEVLDIYAPLAYRLGLEKIKVALENRALEILHPIEYGEILKFLEQSSEERAGRVSRAIEVISRIAQDEVSIVKIKGRPKHIYSIYRKTFEKGTPLDKQYDHLGIRVICSTIRDCYTILALLHQNFEPIEGRLKDYIANPKPNSYRSIHMGLFFEEARLEVQIRTEKMDEFAEEGVAAHWRYKGVKGERDFEKKTAWLKGLLDLQKDGDLLETVKVDVFGDKVYCYTPRGDVKELVKGAGILDFAFMIHEHVGNTAVGGRVNGKFVPLKHVIESGDVIEVVTNKNQRPRRGWLKLVKSAKARQKIRKSLKEHEKLAPTFFRHIKRDVKDIEESLCESEEFVNATCVLAKCCLPIPGSLIVGILTKRRVISVHGQECKRAIKEEDRWVPVKWKETFSHKIRFFVEAHERSGLLADLLHTISQSGFEVKEAKAKLLDREREECSFLVVPRDLGELKQLIERVSKVKGILRIYFD